MLKDSIKVGIPVGAVFVGIQASGALATGSYGTNYFAAYGVQGLLIGLFQALFLFVFFYCGFTHTISVNNRLPESEKVYDYSSLSKALYGKFSPYLCPVFELWQVLTIMVTGAVVIASGVTILQTFFFFFSLLASLLFSVIVLALSIFGEGVVRKASTTLSVLFFVCEFLFLYIVLKHRGDVLVQMIRDNWVPESSRGMAVGIWRMFTLTCASSAWAIGIGAVAQKMTSRRHAVVAALTAGCGAALIMVGTAVIVLPFCPEILSETAPLAAIASNFIGEIAPALGTIYYTLLILALISTGGPALFVFARRFGKLVPAKGAFKNRRLVDIILVVGCLMLCIALSMCGLTTLVQKAFQYLGYIAMPMCIVPLVIVWPILRRRGIYPVVYKKKKQQT